MSENGTSGESLFKLKPFLTRGVYASYLSKVLLTEEENFFLLLNLYISRESESGGVWTPHLDTNIAVLDVHNWRSSVHVVSIRIYFLPFVYMGFIPRPWDKFSLNAFYINIIFHSLWKCDKVKIFENDSNRHNINSRGREDTIPVTFATLNATRNFCLLACCLKLLTIKIYKSIILLVILQRCETWPLPLREEHRVRGVWEWDASENV